MSRDLYVVWGYLAGRVLPPNFTMGDTGEEAWIQVLHDPPESFKRIEFPGILQVTDAGPAWVAGVGRRIRTKSQAVFRVPVRVENPNEAMRAAERDVLPRHLAAISAMTGDPIYGVPVAFHAASEPLKWRSRMYETWVPGWLPSLLDAETVDRDTWSEVAWAAEHDHTARRAAADLYVANSRLQSHEDDIADVRAALLSYFFVLKKISDRIARFDPLKPKESETGPAIEDLEEALAKATTVTAKVKAVHNAAQKLQAMHSRGIERRVKEAGRKLGLRDETVRKAGALAKLRNATLGHVARADEELAELSGALLDAQSCAHDYMGGYLRWVGARGFAAFD